MLALASACAASFGFGAGENVVALRRAAAALPEPRASAGYRVRVEPQKEALPGVRYEAERASLGGKAVLKGPTIDGLKVRHVAAEDLVNKQESERKTITWTRPPEFVRADELRLRVKGAPKGIQPVVADLSVFVE